MPSEREVREEGEAVRERAEAGRRPDTRTQWLDEPFKCKKGEMLIKQLVEHSVLAYDTK